METAYLDSRDFPADSEEYLPTEVMENGWIETLEGVIIESIAANARDQVLNPTLDQLLKTFIYYYKYDSYIQFCDSNDIDRHR